MNNFLLCLIGFGLLAIPCLILAIEFGEDWRGRLFSCAVICVIWLTFAVGCSFAQDINAEKWNGGYCKCGTHWELRGASQYRTSHTKYYVCPDCHAEIEINN